VGSRVEVDGDHDHGDRCRCLPGCPDRCFGAGGNYDGHPHLDQFDGKGRKPLQVPLGAPKIEGKILAGKVAELAKLVVEVIIDTRIRGHQDPYPRHLPRLLRISVERPGEGTGQRSQQEAATVHYSMT
jgi:hypothetical protein